MIVGGILLKGNCARVVTLSGTCSSHVRLQEAFHKLELPDMPTQAAVTAFVQTMQAYVADNNVECLCLNRRSKGRGKHAGGSASFRNEGIILATSPVEVKLVHPTTVTSILNKNPINDSIRPTTSDLGRAYDLAFVGMA